MITKEKDIGLKKIKGMGLLHRRDDIIKLKNIGISNKDITKFLGCIRVGLESFIDNFLIEVDGFYLAKKFSTDDIIIQLGFVIEGMKENELNKQDAYDAFVVCLEIAYNDKITEKQNNHYTDLYRFVKDKMGDKDFKKLLKLNVQIEDQRVILDTAVDEERIVCNNIINKIKRDPTWLEHMLLIDMFNERSDN